MFVLESGGNERWTERKTEAGISGGGANPIHLGDGPLRARPISIPGSGVRTTQSQSWTGRTQSRPAALDGGKEVPGTCRVPRSAGRCRAEACPPGPLQATSHTAPPRPRGQHHSCGMGPGRVNSPTRQVKVQCSEPKRGEGDSLNDAVPPLAWTPALH